MPGSFGNTCPVDEDTANWIESAFAWLLNKFGVQVLQKKMLVPDYTDFPIKFTGKMSDAEKVLQVLSLQMDFDPASIELHIYREGLREVNSGQINRIFMQTPKGEKKSAGLYYGKGENGLYQIGLAEDTLTEPESMIATLAHELAHVKLLGGQHLAENNEPLTDLLTVFFGVGIFNANKAFIHKNTFDSKLIGRSGYLTQMEWGYALAVNAYLREEENPGWLNYLTANVQMDFKNSMEHIQCKTPDIIGMSAENVEAGALPRFKTNEETQEKDLIRKRHAPLPESPFYADYCEANDYYNKGEYAKAAELYGKILDAGGIYWVAFSYGCYALYVSRQYQQLTKLFDIYQNSFNINIDMYINAGYAYSQIGNNSSAALYYGKALEMDAYNVYALNNMGYLLNHLGDFHEAIEHFDLALEVDPQYAFAYNNRAYSKIKLGMLAEAHKDIMLSLKLKPDNAYAYRNLGMYFLERNEYGAALENLEKAKNLDSNVDGVDELLSAAKNKS